MRTSRYMFSERLNPAMAWVAAVAASLPPEPRGAAPENPWMCTEQAFGRQVVRALDEFRTARDYGYERLFSTIYGAPFGPVKPVGSKVGKRLLPKNS